MRPTEKPRAVSNGSYSQEESIMSELFVALVRLVESGNFTG